MATKSDFSADQWRTLRETPHLVVIAVAAAGASGLFGSLKEAIAPAGAMIEALQGDNELLRHICHKDEMKAAVDEIKDDAKAGGRIEDIRAFFADAANARAKAAIAILKEKGSAGDVDAYADFLLKLADKVANAAKEGGFLGFGGERVSEPERAMMASLAAAVGRPSGTLQA